MLAMSVVGARPNFMKIAPVDLELSRRGMDRLLVHTGQHYDDNMSSVFFEQLGMPEPNIHLGVGSDTHARQTARIMTAFEEVCASRRPDLVIVGGDVNSTLAAALVAAKAGVPVAHVEAGLRSFDRTMPEEINRVVTDHLSDLLFTTEESANDNLANEGIVGERVHFVGNCMVDSLLRHLDRAREMESWRTYELEPRGFALLTLHRPSNVDDQETLNRILTAIDEASREVPFLFPVHPRTVEKLTDLGLQSTARLRLVEPLGYLEFLGLMSVARCVLTDSGGIQEETTVLQVPCLTLRDNTERPSTITAGTNRLVGSDPERILAGFEAALGEPTPNQGRPPLWDGRSAHRIVDAIESWSVER